MNDGMMDGTSLPGPLKPEWFETILCSLSDGVFCVDEDWKITCFNQAAARITGVPREDALGRPCHEIFRSSICEKDCALRHTLKTGHPIVNRLITILDARGDEKPISVSTALLRDGDGNVVGGVETFRDLSLVEQLRRQVDARYTFDDILSKSPMMHRLFEVIPLVAESDSTVLITGESGTGKNLVAKAIHNTSHRQEGPFITLNCAAVPETLLESELFGHKAGAFTDARRDKAGRFAQAEGGTLFLDEIGDLSLALQAKLLRVLQDKVYQPLGADREIKADVRIVAATNSDLKGMVEEGRFRRDLYYRINVISMDLPPLRDRREDIPLLVNHFIARFSSLKGKAVEGISPNALKVLTEQPYPGNVRELENLIEYAFVMCTTGVIEASHLPSHLAPSPPDAQDTRTMKGIDVYERNAVLETLKANRWNRQKSADALGIHKTTLFRKMKKLGITPPDRKGHAAR